MTDDPADPAPPPRRRPFRFSSPLSDCRSHKEVVDRARMLEDLGFSTATMADHLDDQLGPIATLMAAAEATDTLRLASLVFCNDYRHPALLAKEAATLDLLSEGRLELGLGAGWMDSDYRQAGIPQDPPAVRVQRMAEGLTVMKALWSGEPTTFAGDHYDIDGLAGTPSPLQRPHPPVIIGGGGRRVLELAAREADIVGFNPNMRAGRIDETAGPSATPAATDRKLRWVHDAAGERYQDLELQIRLELATVTDDRQGLIDLLAAGFGLTPDEAADTPHALAGSISSMCDDLVGRRERWGFSYIGIPATAAVELAPVVSRLAGT